MTSLKLSDPGSLASLDPATAEYLRSYGLPLPPKARYGFARIRAPQKRHGVTLFAQAWVPPQASGTVALLHGYSEHTGNYSRLIGDFVDAQLAVVAFDFRGHGLSEGPAGHAQLPDLYAEDAETVLHALFPEVAPGRPLFLWGHSMGALVGLQLLLRGKLPQAPAAAVFTSPLLGFPELQGLQKALARLSPLLARALPTFPIAHGLPPENLSHDELYLAHRFEDPLIKRVTTPGWFVAAQQSVAQMQAEAGELQRLAPTLLMLAGDERVTSLSEARRFAARAYPGQRHKVIEFPGSFHELEKEPAVRARVVAESIAWLRVHG